MNTSVSFIPSHVGIIMDGNGRWARSRGLPRTYGHRQGLETAKTIVEHASTLGIEALSLYAFSTENWRRAEEEVGYLMSLIRSHLRRQYDFYKENNIRVVHSGNLGDLPESIQEEIILTENDTKDFEGMKVNLLINYGAQDEIIRAASKAVQFGKTLTIESLEENLDQPWLGKLDLLIRSGGEIRLSNFLLWQAAYAELYFDDDFWPDWTPKHLDRALNAFALRQRRYGGVLSE